MLAVQLLHQRVQLRDGLLARATPRRPELNHLDAPGPRHVDGGALGVIELVDRCGAGPDLVLSGRLEVAEVLADLDDGRELHHREEARDDPAERSGQAGQVVCLLDRGEEPRHDQHRDEHGHLRPGVEFWHRLGRHEDGDDRNEVS